MVLPGILGTRRLYGKYSTIRIPPGKRRKTVGYRSINVKRLLKPVTVSLVTSSSPIICEAGSDTSLLLSLT